MNLLSHFIGGAFTVRVSCLTISIHSGS